MVGIDRDAPCPCGSGQGYGQCCAGGERTAAGAGREIEGLLRRGYDLQAQGLPSAACEVWGEAWRRIRPSLRPAMRSCGATGELQAGTPYLSDWIQDYSMELGNAAREDPRCAEAGIAFHEAVLAQFTDEAPLIRENLQGELGLLQFQAGRPDLGERTLTALIDDLPHRAIGYALLSDAFGETGHRWSPERPLDRPRAIALIERALALPVEDGPDYDLQLRLRDLRAAGDGSAS